MLEAKNLSHAFDYPLFHSLNLTLNPGETLSIMGISGSGKSTLLHILSSFLNPKEGSVSLDGKEMYTLKDKELLDIRRNQFGIIFQAHYLFRGFTGLENLEVASLLADEPIDEAMLERFGIQHVIHQPIGELSGGQQQRLSIARVLTKKPKYIFADEPTGNLDKETAHDVMDALFSYVRDESASLLLATHDQQLASQCQHRYTLANQQFIPWN